MAAWASRARADGVKTAMPTEKRTHFSCGSQFIVRIPTAAAAVKHLLLLLLFNTTPTAAAFQHNARAREHAPDPQARESQSPWTEVWPSQPVLTQPR